MNQENNKIEGFEGNSLHPSLDIKDSVLTLGFRYTTKNREEKEVFLIVQNNKNVWLFTNDSFESGGKRYFLEKEGRKLAKVENRWNLQQLKSFVEKYNSLKIKSTPLPKEVFEEILLLSKKYQELEKEIDHSLLTAWCIGSYFFPAFSAYPFLHIKAPKRSGKSQCLNFLKQVCFNAVKARPSLAALGDTVDSLRGTYLIDQADSLRRKGNEDLLDLLADSYKKGGGKRRIMDFDKSKGRRVLEFETYGPKAFASIKELPEDLKDRCFIVPLIRSQRNFPEPDEDNENWKEIRGKLYKFLIGNYSNIRSFYDVRKIEYRRDPKIVGRELELWLPLEIILEICSADKINEAKKRFRQLYGFTEYEPSAIEEEIVKVILNSFSDKSEIVLSPKRIGDNIHIDEFMGSLQEKAAKVGWAIKKFNLASEKKPRTKEGISYLFRKKVVENIYKAYFESPIESTSSTPD